MLKSCSVKGDEPLQVVEYGPTKIMLVPDDVVKKYVMERYKKASFCDFPLGKEDDSTFPKTMSVPLPTRAAQTIEAVSKYYISPRTRQSWLDQVGSAKGNELNREIPNVNHVEIDNSISAPEACKIGTPGRPLKVVGLNAKRGTYWAEFAEMIDANPDLAKPDLVILNEMDIGMARSGNVHTARKLAFRLGMNYAWGVEFVELTNGNREEQNTTMGLKNAMGLHGNAILSLCPIYDPLLVRDKLDERYFSNVAFKGNDMGSVKRLGGRMAMFVRTGNVNLTEGTDATLSSQHVVVGSVHKVLATTQRERIWEYLGFGAFPNVTGNAKPKPVPGVAPSNVLGIVTAGDMESRAFCPEAGLRNLDKPMKHRTFPADCPSNRLGYWRGDQFCGNMKLYADDQSLLPCYVSPQDDANSTGLQISDHAIIQILLKTTVT
jgi:hypothetical protein